MDRKEEIKILINYLKEDTKDTALKWTSLLENTIVKNGKLIEFYQDELKKL